MRKALLIGSEGYLGRHLRRELQRQGYRCWSYDIQQRAYENDADYRVVDLANPADLDHLDVDADLIFMFAGLTGTADGFDRYAEFLRVNELGLMNLLGWMRRVQCRARLVFPSSRLVYAGQRNVFLEEDDPKETKTIYAINKLSAEYLLAMYSNAFGIPYTVFRICVPYGNAFGSSYSYGTIGFFLAEASAGRDIKLYGDGSQRRTFTHVDDLCRIMLQALDDPGSVNQVFNIGGEHLSLLDAATLVAKHFGVEVTLVDWPEMAKRLETGDTQFSDGKLNALVPLVYRHHIASWLEGIVADTDVTRA